jgi:hypothetical protein
MADLESRQRRNRTRERERERERGYIVSVLAVSWWMGGWLSGDGGDR